ncbi:helix-turn-helix domain-containing protein [Bradyrhizobium sp. AZCC 2289]|uniref:helix-turn-helix domain-containing protein n=1 Tax=Bradyrhizobium sp. AZCC 2289 TaxID=3117026 RepID=UPI002FF3063E
MSRKEKDSSRSILARNIRKLRLMREMSQQELARAADTRQALISAIEAGDANPTFDSLARLTDALRVDLAEFFNARAKHE